MTESGIFEREILLCRIIESLQGIRGRKRFQKSLFIAKAMGYPVPEEFVWGNYGVYSSELQWEIDAMVREGLLAERNLSKTGEDPEYEYSLGDGGKTLLEKVKALAAKNEVIEQPLSEADDPLSSFGNNEMEALLRFLGRLKAAPVRSLELWSSILYLRQSERNEANLVAFLRYLKPQYSEAEVREGIREVEDLEIVSFSSLRIIPREGSTA